MYYRLNESHSYNPNNHQNIAAVQKVTDYLAERKTASEYELRSVLSGISNPHGDVVKWLARRSRKVLIPATNLIPEAASEVKAASTNIPSDSIWSNPGEVDMGSPLIYRIEIWSESGEYYDYIGKARGGSRLREYDRNMRRIGERKERGKTQKYRAVHYVLYQAIQAGWKYNCYPMENCPPEILNSREQQLISEHPCTLNGGRGWRVSEIESLNIQMLILRP